MSILIFFAPLAASAIISLWLGFEIRMILFGAWLSACAVLLVLLLKAHSKSSHSLNRGYFCWVCYLFVRAMQGAKYD
jgi:hypothetical protein